MLIKDKKCVYKITLYKLVKYLNHKFLMDVYVTSHKDETHGSSKFTCLTFTHSYICI